MYKKSAFFSFLIGLVLLVCLVPACATSYQPRGVLGDGFSEQKITPETWLVTFDASAFTPRERVRAYLLRRCAEIAVQNGARYFAILGEGVAQRRALLKPTLIDRPAFSLDEAPAEPVLHAGRFARAAIQLYREKPEETAAYDARDVIRQVPPKRRPL